MNAEQRCAVREQLLKHLAEARNGAVLLDGPGSVNAQLLDDLYEFYLREHDE